MRYFIVVLLLLLTGGAAAQPVGPPNEIWCNRMANTASAPATVLVVTGVAAQPVSICGWLASATAAATVQVTTGTGATCGTGTVNITAAHAIPAGGFMNIGGGNAMYSTPAGNSVCIIIGGTGPVQFTLSYAQF